MKVLIIDFDEPIEARVISREPGTSDLVLQYRHPSGIEKVTTRDVSEVEIVTDDDENPPPTRSRVDFVREVLEDHAKSRIYALEVNEKARRACRMIGVKPPRSIDGKIIELERWLHAAELAVVEDEPKRRRPSVKRRRQLGGVRQKVRFPKRPW